jgi:geranylgeranyl pyrophosphate synthase
MALSARSTGFPRFLLDRQQILAAELDRIVPPADRAPVAVHQSIRYTLLGPSKRVRGVLALLTADLFGAGPEALAAASAVELVHASSLILDDLPAMDNTPERRGHLANHLKYGEATAILAAVGLLNLAFGHVASAYAPALATSLTRTLADAIGTDGLIGGQADDLQLRPEPVQLAVLEPIDRRKTAVLFRAAAAAGAMVGGAEPEEVERLAGFGERLGLAFQIVDDILDTEGDRSAYEVSQAGGDGRGHASWIADVAAAKARAGELCGSCAEILAPFGERAQPLCELTRFVLERTEKRA